jgi:hypothetical protein
MRYIELVALMVSYLTLSCLWQLQLEGNFQGQKVLDHLIRMMTTTRRILFDSSKVIVYKNQIIVAL